MDRKWIFSIGLVLASLIVFGVALPNQFFFDDYYTLENNAWLHGLKPPGYWFLSLFIDNNHVFDGYRPILMLSYWINGWMGGPTSSSFRVGNIVLHTLNALLVVRLFLSLPIQKHAERIAWAAGLLFLIHPVQTLPINFLWKRSSVLEATFLLLALILHVRERTRGSYRWRTFGLQGVLYLLAVLTKESGFFLPGYLVATDVLFFDPKALLKKGRTWMFYLFLGAITVSFWWFRFRFLTAEVGRVYEYMPDRRTLPAVGYFYTAFSMVPRYVWLWLSPRPLLVDDPSPLKAIPWGWLAMSVSLLVLPAFFRKKRTVLFAMALFWIGLGPTLTWMPIHYVFDQIRLYVPLIGLSFLMAVFLSATAERIGGFFRFEVLLFIVVLLYGFSSVSQNLRYRSTLRIWEDVVEAYPESGVAWNNLATVLEYNGSYLQAAKAYDEASRVEEGYWGAQLSSIRARLRGGVAVAELLPLIQKLPAEKMDQRTLLNLAGTYAEMGKYKRAETILLELVTRNPSFSAAHLMLGQIWENEGKMEEARKAFLNVLKLTPGNQFAEESLRRMGRGL